MFDVPYHNKPEKGLAITLTNRLRKKVNSPVAAREYFVLLAGLLFVVKSQKTVIEPREQSQPGQRLLLGSGDIAP